jgi:Flp pilus assembly protein TadD
MLAPLEDKAYSVLAMAYRRGGDHDSAIEVWKQALALQATDVQLINGLGLEYSNARRLTEAIAVLEEGARIHPEEGLIQGNLGVFYLQTGKPEKAEKALLLAVEQMPNKMTWWRPLVKIYRRQGRLEEALLQAKKDLQKSPQAVNLQLRVKSLRRALEKSK